MLAFILTLFRTVCFFHHWKSLGHVFLLSVMNKFMQVIIIIIIVQPRSRREINLLILTRERNADDKRSIRIDGIFLDQERFGIKTL